MYQRRECYKHTLAQMPLDLSQIHVACLYACALWNILGGRLPSEIQVAYGCPQDICEHFLVTVHRA